MPTLQRDEKGELPYYAWPGGYPIYYLTEDNGCLCPDCANGRNGSEAHENNDDKQWKLVALDVYYEGPPMNCDHCGCEIESAYGDPEEDKS